MSEQYNRKWITTNALEVLDEYAGTPITIRQLYYRLVARGMPNSLNYYKRVVGAMTSARWDHGVEFDAFVDRERGAYGETKAMPTSLDAAVEYAVTQIHAWANAYYLNRWENQPRYPIVGIEKKALQGVFEGPCSAFDVGLYPMKGYPSLTFLYEIAAVLDEAMNRGQEPILLYFGDYDPSGEDIPRAIEENLARMGSGVAVERIALTPDQIAELGLPGVPAKETDSRSANWSGEGCVELDAVDPHQLQGMVHDAISEYFDEALYSELQQREVEERSEYRRRIAAKVAEQFRENGGGNVE